MKKLFFIFLLSISFQIFPEGKYKEAAKLATEQTNEELKDRTKEVLNLGNQTKLFDGIDIDKILKDAVEKANRELKIDKYIEEMNKLIEELKNIKNENKSDPG